MILQATTKHPNLLDAATITASNIESIDFEASRATLDEFGFLRVQGIFSPDEIRALLHRIRQNFDHTLDKKHDPADTEALRNPLQKVVVGGINGVNNCARLLRMFYLPLTSADPFQSHHIFRRLARFRNLLYGEHPDFAIDHDENGLWTASRIQHYPRGGGFMAEHIDFGTAAAAANAGFERYAQVILLISQKGLDFHSGGAFIKRNDERLFYEDGCESGDIVVYDGRIRHGVADIDEQLPFDFNSINGRLVGFVTLYKRFTQPQNQYRELMSGYTG